MKKLLVLAMLMLAVAAFAQTRYSIGDVDVNEQNLYIDDKGALITGIIVDNGLRYSLHEPDDSEESNMYFEYKGMEYDVTKGKVTNMRFFSEDGLLVGEGMFSGEAFTGVYYIYREDGSLKFRLTNKDGLPTGGWCVQGKNQRELTSTELIGNTPPECK